MRPLSCGGNCAAAPTERAATSLGRGFALVAILCPFEISEAPLNVGRGMLGKEYYHCLRVVSVKAHPFGWRIGRLRL